MVFAVRDLMEGAYPELAESAKRVSDILLAEEKQFARVLSVAITELTAALRKFHDDDSKMIADYLVEVSKRTTPELITAYKAGVEAAQNSGGKIQFGATGARKVFVDVLGPVVGEALFKEVEAKHKEQRVFDGRTAFRLYETFGLPVDLIIEASRDSGFRFDMEGFEAARQE